MRHDARALLEKLSRQDFRYKQFEDRFADMELWPIFEALLKDERVAGQHTEPEEPTWTEAQSGPQQTPPARLPNGRRASDTSFLDRYGQSEMSDLERESTPAADLRNFLAKLGG
jgi:hypothetical protein